VPAPLPHWPCGYAGSIDSGSHSGSRSLWRHRATYKHESHPAPGVWLIFLACCNPLGNSLLRSDVILSDSEESGLRVESIFRCGTDFSFATQMLRPQGTQHDTGRLVCRKMTSHLAPAGLPQTVIRRETSEPRKPTATWRGALGACEDAVANEHTKSRF